MKQKVKITIPIYVHRIQAALYTAIVNNSIDPEMDSLRKMAELIDEKKIQPEKIKHHLEQLVKMGALNKRHGGYCFDLDDNT